MNNEQYKSPLHEYGIPRLFLPSFFSFSILSSPSPPSSLYKVITLGGLLFGNVLMAGILITAALLILGTFTLYFTKPIGEAITLQALYLVL
ncbi:hypothetical protein OWI74_12535, partial [Mammaliicoccus sciuri]|nr:hypothetical protein [Mammaliicoccus sciuri]